MKREHVDALHLEARGVLSLTEVVELSGMGEDLLRELVEYGALQPIDAAAPSWTFTSEVVIVARTAGRLQRDFELDAHALSVVLRFLERIDALEAEVRRLQARMIR